MPQLFIVNLLQVEKRKFWRHIAVEKDDSYEQAYNWKDEFQLFDKYFANNEDFIEMLTEVRAMWDGDHGLINVAKTGSSSLKTRSNPSMQLLSARRTEDRGVRKSGYRHGAGPKSNWTGTDLVGSTTLCIQDRRHSGLLCWL